MKIFIKKLGYCSALIASAYLYSQYDGKVGVNTETPKATLDVSVLTANQNGTTNEGIIAPKLSKVRISKMANPIEGTLVYATDAIYTGSDRKVAKITEKGYYYFDGTEWVRAGGVASGSSSVNTNIYTDNGALNGNRTVTLGNNTLNFSGTKSVTIKPNFGLEVAGQVKVGETLNGSDSDKILVVDNNGIVKKIAKSASNITSDTSIYTGDGILSGNRNVGMNGHNLGFSGNGNVGIGTTSPSEKLHVQGKIKVTETPTGTNTDKILVIGSDNVIKAINKTAGDFTANNAGNNTNIYTNDGTISVNRTVQLGNNSLGFVTGANGKIGIGTGSPDERLHVAGKIKVNDTPVGTDDDKILVIGSDNVIKKVNKKSKDITPDTSIYSNNGSLTGNRNVSLADHNLNIVNTTTGKKVSFNITPGNETLELDGRVKVRTPETGGNTDKILVVGGDGVVKTIAKTAKDITADTNTNLFNTDGDLTGGQRGADGNPMRVINSNNHMLYLNIPNSNGALIIGDKSVASHKRNPGEIFRVNLKASEWFVVNGLNAGNESTDQIVSVDAAGAFHKIPVASLKGNSGAAHNIYTKDDALTGNRTVTMSNHSLTFKGSKNIKLDPNGTITAESYRSSTFNSFPDYVFQKYYSGHSSLKADYTFNTLSQVEDYIKTNGHLPGYQSAMEIKNQGYVDITKTQLSNVEKIEELYLHTIEQDKELKNKDKKIKELEYRLEKLESLLSKFNK